MISRLPLGWEMKPLEDICERVSVGHVGETSSFFVESDGIPFIRSQNVRPSKVDLSDVKFITHDFHQKSKKSQLQGGDLLIVRVGQNRGDCAVLPKNLGEVNCANIVFARPKCSYSDFLGSYFNTPKGHEALLSLSSGSAQLVLNTKAIAKLEVPIPPPREARAIGAINKLFDDRITLLREANATLEAIAQALFKSWFVDFDPVHAKQQGLAPEGMDEATAALFPDSFEDSGLGLVPRGWHAGTLADLTTVKGGFAYKSEAFGTEGLPVIKIKNIVGDGTVNLLDCQFISAEIAEKTKKFALKDGDIVIAMTGATIGKTGVVVTVDNQTPYLNQRVAKFEASSSGHNNTWFVYVAFQNSFIFDQVVNAASGSAQPNISTNGIESVRLVLPSNSELLSTFNDIVSPLFNSWMANTKQAQTLATLRDTLLPRLISGQLRLPEAEILIKETQ